VQREHTCCNPKRLISLVNVFLCRKMAALFGFKLATVVMRQIKFQNPDSAVFHLRWTGSRCL